MDRLAMPYPTLETMRGEVVLRGDTTLADLRGSLKHEKIEQTGEQPLFRAAFIDPAHTSVLRAPGNPNLYVFIGQQGGSESFDFVEWDESQKNLQSFSVDVTGNGTKIVSTRSQTHQSRADWKRLKGMIDCFSAQDTTPEKIGFDALKQIALKRPEKLNEAILENFNPIEEKNSTAPDDADALHIYQSKRDTTLMAYTYNKQIVVAQTSGTFESLQAFEVNAIEGEDFMMSEYFGSNGHQAEDMKRVVRPFAAAYATWAV